MDEELMIVHLLSDAHNLQGSWGGATVRQDYATMMMITMCEVIESFANIHTSSSEQHKDLRPISQARDHKNLETFLQWLKIHSPFTFADKT